MSGPEVAYLPGGRRANADKLPGHEVRRLTHSELLRKLKEDDDERDCWPVQRRHLAVGEWEMHFDMRARRAGPWDSLIRGAE